MSEPFADHSPPDPGQARKKAMDYLARREHGRRELTEKLVAAGFEAVTAEATVEQLAGEGLQDDRRFVENFIQSRINQGKGPVRVRAELSQRGLDPGTIDEAVSGTEVDWFGLARDVREKKFGPARPADFGEKAHQMNFLQYRGFEQAHIQAAMGPATQL